MDHIFGMRVRSDHADGCGYSDHHRQSLELGPNVIVILGLGITTLVRVAARQRSDGAV